MSNYVQGTSLDELMFRVQVGGAALAVAAAVLGIGVFFATKRTLDWQIRLGVGAVATVIGVSILAAFSWAISAFILAVALFAGLAILKNE